MSSRLVSRISRETSLQHAVLFFYKRKVVLTAPQKNRNFENPESGFRIVSNMARNEGFMSFFKGLTPKLLMTGPKLVFSFWLAQTLIPIFDKKLHV